MFDFKKLAKQWRVLKAQVIVDREANLYGKCIAEEIEDRDERELVKWYIKEEIAPSFLKQLT